PAQIAGVEPTLLQRLLGRRLVLVVALEDVRALDQDLAVVGDLHLDALLGLADRAEAELARVRAVDRRAGGRLGHPVALHYRHAAGVEELEDLRRDRRRAGDALADVLAEQAADVL